MLTEYACTRRELSCLIGNLFTEIEPPCERCGAADVLTISGTTYTGSRAVLTVTEYGFTWEGDPAEVEEIRERRCVQWGISPGTGNKQRYLLDSGKITLKQVEQSYGSWRSHAEKGNCYHLIREMDELFMNLFPEIYSKESAA